VLLQRLNDTERALAEVERLLSANPRSPAYRNLCAVILSRIGEYERSCRIYEELLNEYPAHAKVWLSYGHVLKTEGRQDQSIHAYRQSIVHDPAFGEAYWSLANLKTFRFDASDLAAMQSHVAAPELDAKNRPQFHFALGKAFEDSEDHARSFEHYAQGNALHRAAHPYDADLNTKRIAGLKRTFTREFFGLRAGWGCDAPDPIFIVGMPRAGSTLLEQIPLQSLAVEGTNELRRSSPWPRICAPPRRCSRSPYTEVLARRSAAELREMGERYIERTYHRKTDRPFSSTRCRTTFCTSE
jgi:tetratricopeptide (TPR) repeat protein